jgi:Skp family chaperone for outer membrane proteins
MRRPLILAAAFLALWGGAAAAQETQPPVEPSALLTLDDVRLFEGSQFGRALIARHDAEAQELITENRRIEAALEQEEKDLTNRRATMNREEFTPIADAFNTKVEGIRAAQGAKERDLSRKFETERQRFFEAVRPVLAQILAARGAVAIIDKRAVFFGFDNIDITADAIAQLDKAFADGSLALQ